MIKVSAKEIQRLDRVVIEKYGIPSLVLMENAGRAVAHEAAKDLRQRQGKRVCVVCGTGNNGGDGFVTARHLRDLGIPVQVFLAGKKKDLKPDAKVNAQILKSLGHPILEIAQAGRNFVRALRKADVIIDALFGVGLNRDLGDPWRAIIEKMNESRRPILAVDVPSGLDATTGRVCGVAVKANKTVTFTFSKSGFYRADGPAHVGKVVVAEIGIPLSLISEVSQ